MRDRSKPTIRYPEEHEAHSNAADTKMLEMSFLHIRNHLKSRAKVVKNTHQAKKNVKK